MLRARVLRARFDATLTAVAVAWLLPLGGCDSNVDPNTTSVLQLVKTDTPTPVDAAKWMFDPYDSDKRYRGTVLLANAPFGGESVYVKGYIEHLSDPDASVRAAAAFAVGQHGSPEDVPLLLPLLKQDSRYVRLNTVRALQRLHNPVAVPGLLERLDPSEIDGDVRAAAATALGQYAESRVLQALIAAIDDERLSVNIAANTSLHTLTGQDFRLDRAEWFAWVSTSKDPFAGRTTYIYPTFARENYFWEYLPFWPPPPNEVAASPVGLAAATTPTMQKPEGGAAAGPTPTPEPSK
ncbi:MAG: HEAT repeat domain-containing protein [Phycisphaeraceae bacterium]|nr:HEAT repeat domain-containing protein [Phycisphaeraceae bacterium]